MPENRNLFDEGFQSLALIGLIEKRTAFVKAEDQSSGGVVIDWLHVLTTYHSVEGKAKIEVNRSQAVVVDYNKRIDLALLACEKLDSPPGLLVISEAAKLNLPVVMCCPFRKRNKRVSYQHHTGRITKVESDLVCADMLTQLGSCGSGLWSESGALLGIADTDDHLMSTQAIPGSVIKQFLRRALNPSSKQPKPHVASLPFEQQGTLLP